MTHLTQIILDFATAARLRLRDCYDWHQAVWKAFPGRDGDRRDFLTRLDQQRDGFRLLIVSPIEPTRPDWCPPESWQSRPIPDNYFSRRRYAFQLCANPTKKITKLGADGSPTKNGNRVPLRTREEFVGWIGRKGDQGGFAVDKDTLRTFSRGREHFEKQGMRGMHSAVELQGMLSVTDPTKFYEAFTRGIGSAKAFGFGLLVIAPTN
ncbi:MAG: type I-E CRISPR-associated protein Cas6/Cse3/CasE [Tepidisphaeraceae bacterium]|jgi:CRISPR system Cascade subunit CasE